MLGLLSTGTVTGTLGSFGSIAGSTIGVQETGLCLADCLVTAV